MSTHDRSPQSRAYDPSGMLQIALGLPLQIREGWAIGRAAPLPHPPDSPANIVVCGMGGSAIGGDLLSAYLAPRISLPIVVVRGYEVPAFVGPHSIVIASSYSGNTEETLAATASAERAGAAVLKITSGGRLGEAAARTGNVILVPGGLSPRAALGYLMPPALAALERWGLTGPCQEEVAEAVTVLEGIAAEAAPAIPAPENKARLLGDELLGRVPAVFAASPGLEAVARRWKGQFNENSKTLATWNMFPELNHNETVGWGAPPEIASLFSVVLLLDGTEPAHLLRRIRMTRDLAFRGAGGVYEVRARGTGRLARLLSLVFWGDLVSIYLAYRRGVDPTPVETIDAIKEGLSRAE